jgi:hypothetical protein
MQSKKKSSSPTVWHNSLAKSKSNLHQELWEKQNYICALPPLENFISWILLYFLFHFSPSHLQGNDNVNHDPRARTYIREGRWVLPSFDFCQVGLPNCWRLFFLVLPKLYGCQVSLPNCWSYSKFSFSQVFSCGVTTAGVTVSQTRSNVAPMMKTSVRKLVGKVRSRKNTI